MAIASIQGEQQRVKDAAVVWMTESDVDAHVDKMPPEVVTCRRRRHDYDEPPPGTATFNGGVDDDGNFVQLLRCRRCRMAHKRQLWEAVRRAGRVRYRPIGRATVVYKRDPEGRRYNVPSGLGRMTSRQVEESVMSAALAGQSLADVRKAALAAAKSNEEK